MYDVRQYFLQNPIGGEVYVADMTLDEGIIGIYGPIHFTGIQKKYLGKYGTGKEDVEWARNKDWEIIRLDR